MEEKGFLSIEYLFLFFILLVIAISFLFYVESVSINNENSQLNAESRLFLDSIADNINQVNSNGEGFIKQINLPDSISGKSYLIEIKSNEILIDIDGKKGISHLIPVFIVNKEGKDVQSIKLYHGDSYIIQKLNESKIRIFKVN